MKPLNKVSTAILVKMIDTMGNLEVYDFDLPADPTIRLIKGEQVSTDKGPGYLLIMGHIEDKRKATFSDRMQFIVIDNRHLAVKSQDIAIFPTQLWDCANDIEEEGIPIINGTAGKAIVNVQSSHVNLAATWLLDYKIAKSVK
jgi:hypothetical protein